MEEAYTISFRFPGYRGDIEKEISVEDSTADLVAINQVLSLYTVEESIYIITSNASIPNIAHPISLTRKLPHSSPY